MWLAANPSVTDWIQAGSSLALIAVAVLGFLATIHTITQARNRQALEIEGYIRVDVGPPQPTADYEPPEALRFVQTDKLRVLGEAPDDAPTISVFYRNLQQHPLGIAHGVRGVVVAEVTAENGDILTVEADHQIAYVEPGCCVRIDLVRFPSNWRAYAGVGRVTYKNPNWDGAESRHGRWECYYEAGQFRMIPWSDPRDDWRDRLSRIVAFRKSRRAGEEQR